MGLGILKIIRFVVPPALILVYAALLGGITGWWSVSLPDFEKALYLPVLVIPGALYYITPLRRWVNTPHHNLVSEKLRKGLVEIAGYEDKEDRYTWKKLRPLFFSLIDQDESLKQKASLAYANGAIWTSFADATALAIIFALLSGVMYLLKIEYAFLAGIIFVLIALACYLGSLVTTSRHIGIGAEQLEIMELKYKSEIEKRLNSLDR